MHKLIFEMNRNVICTNLKRISKENVEMSARNISAKSEYDKRSFLRLLNGSGRDVSYKLVNELISVTGLDEEDLLKKNFAKNFVFKWKTNTKIKTMVVSLILMILFSFKAVMTRDVVTIYIVVPFFVSNAVLHLESIWVTDVEVLEQNTKKWVKLIRNMLAGVFVLVEFFRGIII